jgi:hypothetical protein
MSSDITLLHISSINAGVTLSHLRPRHVGQHPQPEARAEMLYANESRQLGVILWGACRAVGAVHLDTHAHTVLILWGACEAVGAVHLGRNAHTGCCLMCAGARVSMRHKCSLTSLNVKAIHCSQRQTRTQTQQFSVSKHVCSCNVGVVFCRFKCKADLHRLKNACRNNAYVTCSFMPQELRVSQKCCFCRCAHGAARAHAYTDAGTQCVCTPTYQGCGQLR